MKTVKTLAAILALAISAASVQFASPAQAAQAYVPPAKIRSSLEDVKAKASAWYSFRVSSVGKTQADAQATTIADKLGVMQLRARGNRVKTYLYSGLRQHLQALVAGTSAGTAGTGTAVPAKAVTETKQLTKDETKAVTAAVATTGGSGDPSTVSKLKDAGLSAGDASIMSTKTGAGDDIYFCAPFTGDLYPIESKYNGAQSVVADQEKALRERISSGGNDIWWQYKSEANGKLYKARGVQYGRAVACAQRLGSFTQASMKALFDKLNLTYTVQTKAYYDQGVDAKDLDAWVKGLNIGKAK